MRFRRKPALRWQLESDRLLEIWTPPTKEKRRVWRCESCGREYPHGPENRRKFVSHAVKCFEVNEEVIGQEFADEAEGSIYTNRDHIPESLEVKEKYARDGKWL